MMRTENKEHFDRYSKYYQESSHSWSEVYPQIAHKIDPLIQDKLVLDIGNGGVFCYNVNYPEAIIACDLAYNALVNINTPCYKVVGDALQLGFIKQGTVDVIVMSLILHHLAGSDIPQSMSNIRKILSSALSILKQGGYLVVVENLLPQILYAVEKLSFPLTVRLLSALQVPPIYFYSKKELLRLVHDRSDAVDIEVTKLKVPWTQFINPFGATLKHFIPLPAWLLPTRFHILVLKKHDDA